MSEQVIPNFFAFLSGKINYPKMSLEFWLGTYTLYLDKRQKDS